MSSSVQLYIVLDTHGLHRSQTHQTPLTRPRIRQYSIRKNVVHHHAPVTVFCWHDCFTRENDYDAARKDHDALRAVHTPRRRT